MTRWPTRIAGLAATLALGGGAAYGTGAAVAGSPPSSLPAPAHRPGDVREPLNIADLVTQIDRYYGGTKNADGSWSAAAESPYTRDVRRVEQAARKHIAEAARKHTDETARKGARRGGKPAVVLDVDDTMLLTYDYEKSTNFTYAVKSFTDYVRKADRGPVHGMPELVNYAKGKGMEIFFLTASAEDVRAPFAKNLAKVGVRTPLDRAHLFLKDKVDPPAYLRRACGAGDAWTCDGARYKAATRKYIESRGYDLVASIGDQASDFPGGHADRTFKLPNPMYRVD
ncbi:HAD family acid phosphatase [Streptomyces sp. NPDC091272]|uniref:HAD family acid phosphatase n=1 Tax=Streptomyces sp. NPDC091272 TaxID=3365981 RepID=UPI003829A16D